jgi:hypothetical protein
VAAIATWTPTGGGVRDGVELCAGVPLRSSDGVCHAGAVGDMCLVCAGERVTDRVRYGVTLDDEERQAPVERRTTEQCSHCRGTGTDD